MAIERLKQGLCDRLVELELYSADSFAELDEYFRSHRPKSIYHPPDVELGRRAAAVTMTGLGVKDHTTDGQFPLLELSDGQGGVRSAFWQAERRGGYADACIRYGFNPHHAIIVPSIHLMYMPDGRKGSLTVMWIDDLARPGRSYVRERGYLPGDALQRAV